jgi:hypothetical protein
MSLLVRLILIVSLLAQFTPGLVVQRCVGMPDADALAAVGLPEDAECDCCGTGDDGALIECPMAAQGYVGCNCTQPQLEGPKSPPPSNQKPIQHFFAFVPVLVAILPVEPTSAAVPWRGEGSLLRASPPSFRSLLCVWLM